MDQLPMLTVVATLSTRIRVASVTANLELQHPLLLIREVRSARRANRW
jgi:hypothetical protein